MVENRKLDSFFPYYDETLMIGGFQLSPLALKGRLAAMQKAAVAGVTTLACKVDSACATVLVEVDRIAGGFLANPVEANVEVEREI